MSTKIKSRLGRGAGLLAMAIALVGGWEGVRTVAYPDRFADGLPTVCFGETRGVKLGDSYTLEECKVMLGDALVDFEQGMRACLKAPDDLPGKSYVAFLSAAYNIGIRAFCGSSMARLANAGDVAGACDALLKWVRAGGREIKGLVNRRKAERELCLEGVMEGR